MKFRIGIFSAAAFAAALVPAGAQQSADADKALGVGAAETERNDNLLRVPEREQMTAERYRRLSEAERFAFDFTRSTGDSIRANVNGEVKLFNKNLGD